MPLPDLDILVAIADHGNLTSAAEHLGVPRPTLSRRLTRLEEDFGARLVHRTTRRVTLTDAGQQLYRHARPIVAAVESAHDAIRARDGVPRGLVRVSIPGAAPPLTDMFADFLHRYPEVRLELVAAARHVDLVAEGFDLAIRAGRLTGPSLVSRRIFRSDVIAVANPDYLARRGTPRSPDDLVEHDCLVGFERGEVPLKRWPLTDGGSCAVNPRIASNSPVVLTRMAVQGLGITLLPKQFARRHLATGELVELLTESIGVTAGAWLVYPERRLMLPRVRALIDHAVQWLHDHPLEDPP